MSCGEIPCCQYDLKGSGFVALGKEAVMSTTDSTIDSLHVTRWKRLGPEQERNMEALN